MLRTVIAIALALVMLSCSELYFWQKAAPDNNYQAIRIEQGDSIVVFNIGSKQEVKTIPEATYFWFNSKEIKYTQGGFSGNPLDGKYEVFYPNGNLKSKGSFTLGLKDGEWLSWHANQRLAATLNYRKGVRHGSFENYDRNGAIVREGSYLNGQLNGKVSVGSGEEMTTYVYQKGAVSDTLDVSKK